MHRAWQPLYADSLACTDNKPALAMLSRRLPCSICMAQSLFITEAGMLSCLLHDHVSLSAI